MDIIAALDRNVHENSRRSRLTISELLKEARKEQVEQRDDEDSVNRQKLRVSQSFEVGDSIHSVNHDMSPVRGMAKSQSEGRMKTVSAFPKVGKTNIYLGFSTYMSMPLTFAL